ncbi:MAG: hypothetical protein QG650_1074 [Patescibacteria group bacterium]|nr:hypothetical protein [Patescibacteria group bacterium]
MPEVFYGWLAVAVVALILEMFSGTLYGLSFSLSGFIIAAYVAITGETELTIAQALIFAISGAVFCFVFPKWFNKTRTEFKQGLDAVVGKTFPLKKVGDDFKISVDGVDYLVDSDCVTDGFAPKAKVRIESHASGTLTVSLVK